MIAYQGHMLPQVDYQKIEKNSRFSLMYLEYRTMQDCCDFLAMLKSALMEENLMQVPELLVAHLCAYVGTAVTVHTVHHAEKLESSIMNLIKHQAHTAYQHFNRYPINGTIKSDEQKKKNVETLRQATPSSIVVQTMRLGHVVMGMLEELKNHRQEHFKNYRPQKQSELFCSQETLIKIMLVVSSKKCAEWREQLEGLSDHYVINQLAIQIGWLIGYFSHLDNRLPDETQYFAYGLPLINLYREHIYKLMHAYASAKEGQEELKQPSKNPEVVALLSEIRCLSEKTHAQITPAFTEFQKQVAIAQARIEKTLIELLMQGYTIKIILMSLFYFWFTLDVPLRVEDHAVFNEMKTIIKLVKTTTAKLPKPQFSSELTALNKKMQLLKAHLPKPEDLDKEMPENIEEQTTHINTTIYAVVNDLMNKDIHQEAITTVLFSHWMRFSVFFGVSESDWQKMDYYLPDILRVVRDYLCTL